MTREQALNIINSIIQKHNCTIVDLDFDNFIIEIDGSDEDLVACSLELDEVMKNYLA